MGLVVLILVVVAVVLGLLAVTRQALTVEWAV